MEHVKMKKVFTILAIMLVITFVGNVLISFAATSTELKDEHNKKQEEINDTKNEQEKIRKQMTAIQKEVEELNSQIANYQNEINDLSDQIDGATKRIEETQIELEKTQKKLEERQELLEKRLVASYKAGDTTYLDMLLSSESLTSFLSSYYFIEQLAQKDSELIQTIEDTKKQIEDSKKILEESKIQLEDAKKNQELKKQVLDLAKKEKNQKVSELSDEDRALQKKIEEMQSEDARIRAAIKKAEEEERRNQANGGNAPTSNPGGYIYPVPAAYSRPTTGLYYSNGSYHGAVDFGTGGINGQPVYAVKSGTVVLTQALTTSYGNYVLINHHDGTYTLYAHGQAGSICVSSGQKVSQGQQIMRVGNTGNSSGPHLHFEVRLSPGGYSNRVNPLNYLPKR